MQTDLLGVVLVGGTSRRMGKDKALLPHPSGGTFLDHALSLFRAMNIQGAVSGHITPQSNPQTKQIVDQQRDEGPLMGLISALEAYPQKNLLVVAVDMPGLQVGALAPLIGDITTLMVWQKGLVGFSEFFAIFVPSVVNWIIPATIMSFTVGSGKPAEITEEVHIREGGIVVVFLFIGTITTAVSFHNFLHMPPVVGMMTGLGVLMLYCYYLKMKQGHGHGEDENGYDVFHRLQECEWDTLMFFYGIILCVGGLGQIGYLAVGSQYLYVDMGPTFANTVVGIASAIVDNIPVMFAVLTELPAMDHGQWLLVTLTAGVGGSMLSIGSAAGVALMGQARGVYTFFAHLKWTWAIALGYAASIWVHLEWNADLFDDKIVTLEGKKAPQVEKADAETPPNLHIEVKKEVAPAPQKATESQDAGGEKPADENPQAPIKAP